MAALVQRIRARAASLPTFDIPFLLILLLLLSYGLIMLFSAGYAVALYRQRSPENRMRLYHRTFRENALLLGTR